MIHADFKAKVKEGTGMPIIKSAKKRVRQTNKAKTRNAETRSNIRTALKSFRSAVTGKKNVANAQSAAQSALDKAAKKGVMHPNKVARKKRQLAAAAKAAGVKVEKKAAKPAVAKKAATKKPAATKKVAAKKPAAKKAATKK